MLHCVSLLHTLINIYYFIRRKISSSVVDTQPHEISNTVDGTLAQRWKNVFSMIEMKIIELNMFDAENVHDCANNGTS